MDPAPTVTLRAMRPTDRAALVHLGHEVFARFGDYDGALRQWLQHTRVCTVVAQHEKRPVGFAMVAPIDRESGGVDAYLLAIAVEPSMRCSGLGHRLLERAVEEARLRRSHWGVHRLRLDVASDNAAAIRLFEGAGFEAEVAPGAAYTGGQQALSMVLPLV